MTHNNKNGVEGRLLWLGIVIMVLGCWLAASIQTAGGVRVQDVRFTGSNGTAMSGLLYIPPNATAETPAPAVLVVHGYFNSREAQDGFAIEFSRRGYVVLAIDQTGHGYSQPPAFANAFGGIDGLKYLRSLDIVDKNNVGLEGHSMGGWAVVNAAAAIPDGYKALVLEGSSTGAPYAPEGTTSFPRNLAVVFSRYDEVPEIMWGVNKATNVTNSQKMQGVFGTSETIVPGKVYGSMEAGSARVLYTPAGTHPMDHIYTVAIGHAVDWMQNNLDGGKVIPADDQIWYWKEIGTLVALIGFAVFILGVLGGLLNLPYFAVLKGEPQVSTVKRDTRWWITLAVGALIPAATFLPFCRLGGEIIPINGVLSQKFASEVTFWALLNVVIILSLAKVFRAQAARAIDQIVPSIILAVWVFAIAYAAVAMADFFFEVDFRIWFIAFKVMSHAQAAAFAVYLLPFVIFFVVALRSLHVALAVSTDSAVVQYLANIAALAAGFVVFLLMQYGLLFSGHKPVQFHIFDPLRLIISINFVPLMIFVAVVSTFAYRHTGRYLPGALICAAFVTWYMVVGQATQGG
ncbi:MAG: alpha/beta fold hydrolase [Exilibacterium sp.]